MDARVQLNSLDFLRQNHAARAFDGLHDWVARALMCLCPRERDERVGKAMTWEISL